MWLARAGVGHLTLIDRDLVELGNLQRQILYSEADIGKPKAIAAKDILASINSSIDIQPLVTDVTSGNALAALSGYSMIMDGTDNFEARYLINDVSIKCHVPWVYCGAIGSEAMAWPISPPETPCLRCLMEDPPEAGDVDTCDSAGVMGPAVGIAASWAAMEAIKILTGGSKEDTVEWKLARFDLWKNERQFISGPTSKCKYCTGQITEFLDDRWSVRAHELCGLDGVQIRVNPPGAIDLLKLKPRLEARTGSEWNYSELALSGADGEWKATIFKDGRALLHGKVSPERARSWYSEVVGC
jgi:adenylyltransferase/sulfurtransferase